MTEHFLTTIIGIVIVAVSLTRQTIIRKPVPVRKDAKSLR